MREGSRHPRTPAGVPHRPAVDREGPGAAPFRARRKLVSNALLSSAAGDGGSQASKPGRGPYGSGGRRLGSESCSKVASVDGASGSAVNA